MTQLKQKWQFETVNNTVYIDTEIVVHRFEIDSMHDTLTAASPLYEWEQSEAGKWVMSHAVEKPRWQKYDDPVRYNTKFAIIARLTEQDITYFKLKFE